MYRLIVLALATAVALGQQTFTPKQTETKPLTRRLRESCTSNRDCGVIFSECNESICVCREGFSEDNNDGFCRAPKLVCPKATKDGSTMETPVKGSGEICESYFDRGLDRIRHNCTNQEVSFCFTHGAVENFEGKQIGHCCPVPAESVLVPVCPLGVGLTDATCPEITGPDQPVVQKRTCPINTYECAGIPTRKEKVCCPLVCTDPRFVGISSTGLCWERVEVNEECKYTAQCPAPNKCRLHDDGRFRCF